MNKAVIKSVTPKLCEKIASGECAILLSKTKPKLNAPFKCYIYCSQNQFMAHKKNGDFWFAKRNSCIQPIDSIQFSGKVIGEFICDKVETYDYDYDGVDIDDDTLLKTKLDREEINIYAKGKTLYGWQISDLKIYDKTKELSEFKKAGFLTEEQWLSDLYPNTHCHYEAWAKRFEIASPPRSLYYVEEVHNE